MTESSAVNQPKRRGGKPFQKGQSGNPAGKPAGTRNATTLAVEALLDGEAKAITRVAIDKALAGDPIALRLVLERVAPVRRGRPVQFDLPPLENATDLAPAIAGILKATAAGDLTPEEASTIATLLEAKRKAIETGELEQRLDLLEQRVAARDGR